MNVFQVDPSALLAMASSMDDLASQLEATAAVAKQAGSSLADATGEPVAAGAVDVVEGRWAEAMQQIAAALHDDAARLRQNVHDNQVTDQSVASTADGIVNKLLGG